MSNSVEKVVDLIKKTWVVTDETANRIYFKYKERRGVPRFYFNKNTLEVVRIDTSRVSSKDAISVEVHTAIYSLLDEEVKPVTAQEVFNNRHDKYIENLVLRYNSEEPTQQGGGVVE